MAGNQTQDPPSYFYEIVKVGSNWFRWTPLVTIYYINQSQRFEIVNGVPVNDIQTHSYREITVVIHKFGAWNEKTFKIRRNNGGGYTMQTQGYWISDPVTHRV
ncbi:hypothetical protein ABFA07_021663 [Porites harrisoni]